MLAQKKKKKKKKKKNNLNLWQNYKERQINTKARLK